MSGEKCTISRGTRFSLIQKIRFYMTLTIVLFVLVLLGFVMFGYGMNKKKNMNKEDALKSGQQVRQKDSDR